MTDNYVFFINNQIDYNFIDIGIELFKIGIALTYAIKNKKKFVITDINYLKILETFININFNLINVYILNNNYKSLKITVNGNDYGNEIISNNDCIIKIDFSFHLINEEIRDFLSSTIIKNPKYSNDIYNKLNDIMIFFNDFEINNYVSIIISKNTYIKDYYEKAYYNNFSNCKLIIFTDDINWTIKYVNFTNINNIYIILNNYNDRFFNFILISNFNKLIIRKDNYYGLWCAYLGNKNKIIIVPNDLNDNYYINNWLKQ